LIDKKKKEITLNTKKEPIAIVGMACRFPGGCDSPDKFWEILKNGVDLITEVNSNRWSKDYYFHPDPKSSGKTYTTAAGQLSDIYQFDPEFFGISPREAAQMDPQQRLLLQMSWEALENGGQIPANLAGTDCSVYVGISSLDYANNRMDDPNVADAYFMTGNTLSIAANRISYIYDLHGPSMAIDTACSSSLVALHQACSSIWAGESDSSIVGAVHLVLSPFPFIGFSKANMLSNDGRCKVFDAAADGYVRSEGGVVLYLKPLSQAKQDGDNIHAVIRGTSVNSDGNKSALTVPNGLAQTRLLHNVYSTAGINTNDIDYIEAHGTGTPVGDPIEADAIGKAIGNSRNGAGPLRIGSVKSNIGHLEPASGFAGLLKVVLSLKHRVIPATIHQNKPNPNIDLKGLNLEVVNQLISLPIINRPLVMGVNSFGFGGTNAHTIIEEFPASVKDQNLYTSNKIPPLYISAQSEESLKRRAAQYYKLLQSNLTKQEIYDLFYASAIKLQKMKYSIVVFADSVAEIIIALSAFIDGKRSEQIVRTDEVSEQGKLAFVFSGNGSQWFGMGKDLLEQTVFKKSIEEFDIIFEPLSGWSVKEAIANDEDTGIDYTEVAQPLLFAIQVGIVELLKDIGVTPDTVLGHSVGEIAAAYVSGALTLEDAVKVIYFRSNAQGKTKGQGKMAAVRLSAEEIQPILDNYNGEIEIAAINSDNSVTISGNSESLNSVLYFLQEKSVSCRELDIDYAFHSYKMDSIKDYIQESLNGLSPQNSEIEFVSTVTGMPVKGDMLNGTYWWKNIRNPVKFGPAISVLIEKETRNFIEIGPHPVLQSYIRDSLRHRSITGTLVKTLSRNDTRQYRSVLSAGYKLLFIQNTFNLNQVFPVKGNTINIPNYPWNNESYIFVGSNEAINKVRCHPLLGFLNNEMDGVWTNHLDINTHSYLSDHVLDGLIVFPAAGFAEMALAAAQNWHGKLDIAISNFEIRKPMLLEQGITKLTQFTLSVKDLSFSIKSKNRLSDDSWIEHACGKIISQPHKNNQVTLDIDNLPNSGCTFISKEDVYKNASLCGLDYGKSFQGVTKVTICPENSVLTEIELPESLTTDIEDYLFHPVAMDSAFHTLFSLLQNKEENLKRYTYIPTEINTISLYGKSDTIGFSKCTIHSSSNNLIKASFALFDRKGVCVAEMKECLFRKLPRNDTHKKIPSLYYYDRIPKNLINPLNATILPSINNLISCIHDIPNRDSLVASENLMNEQIMPLFDAMASVIAEKTFREFGAHLGLFTIDSLITTSAISNEFKLYLKYLLSILELDGKAHKYNDQWKMVDSDEIDDPIEIWRSILADYPEYIGILRDSASHGLRIVDNLTGHIENEFTSIKPHQRPIYVGMSSLQEEVLQIIFNKIRQEWPGDHRRLRIAEIRNHISRSSMDILSQLPEAYCDYEILAMDDYSLNQAEETYRENSNVTVSRFDPSNGGLHQKYKEGEFDIVLLSQGIHRCHSLTDVFSQISYILASSGLLILLDKRPDRMTDINMGLAESDWWHRSNEEDTPLSSQLYPEEWLYLLESTGFEEPVNIMDKMAKELYRYVIIARRPIRISTQSAISPDNTYACVFIASDGNDSTKIAQLLKSETVKDGVQSTIVAAKANEQMGDKHVVLDLLDESDLKQLVQLVEHQSEIPLKIIYLAGTNQHNSESSTLDIGHRVSRINTRLINFIVSLTNANMKKLPSVWLVTTGAVSSSHINEIDYNPNPYQAGLWSIGRVIRNEYPDIDLRQIDIQSNVSSSQISRLLWNEIQSGDGEEEIILNELGRKALRLNKKDISSEIYSREKLSSINKIYQLGFSRSGSIENLEWSAQDRRLPGLDELEVEVRATGLNFRDIMFTSGFLPGEMLENGLSGATLGLECSGVVTRIGNNIENVEVGDEVIALAPACFSSHIIASKFAVMKKPKAWSFEAAATIPTTFLTIYYALHTLARLKKNERILIHGAAGGVGLAAIQYAHHCGAEIFATAGTPEKRKFLEFLGVDHVLDSRSLEFADQIMDITNNEGVDIILNSLAGEAMTRNFKVLRPFGRFLELGKRDFFENTKLDLKPFKNNITYFGIDADQLLQHEPERSAELMKEVMELFDSEVFRPLPYTAFTANDVEGAFRYMQQSQHIGKVIVSQKFSSIKIKVEANKASLELISRGTYLVTGGLSGFGLATAQWLVTKGARHLVLLGRTGITESATQLIVDEMRNKDIDVKVVLCDVTDAIKMQSVLHDIQDTPFPLKGVFHAAMVLDDNLIRNVDYNTMYKVVAPKVQGAWNIHRLTKEYNLDLFVMYSSVTSSIGNPGQSNYVAANAFLESLAKFRKKSGHAATVIAWDAITDTGYLARNEQLSGRLTKRLGLGGITSEQAFDALETLILTDQTETIVFNANWAALKRALPVLNSNLYRNIMHGLSMNEGYGGEDLVDLLSRLDNSERQPVVVNFLIGEIARILQMPEEKIAHNCTIQDLGIDSLMAMELATTIEVKLGIDLPVLTLADNVTLDGLANRIINMLDLDDNNNITANNSVNDIVTSLAKIHAEEFTEEELQSISYDIDSNQITPKRLIK
jgi:phthiocerol/phenolphthiocerol synthesis type-I polyketide synthase C